VPEQAIIETLHTKALRTVRNLINAYVVSQANRLTIIVDGLDGNWGEAEDQALLADVLLALLSSARESWREINQFSSERGKPEAVSYVVFVRSDIFRTLLERAKEPDKLLHETLSWGDVNSLLTVVNRRIQSSLSNTESKGLNWSDLLDIDFSPKSLTGLIERDVLFRPRDILVYFKKAFEPAVWRDSMRVSRLDFESAMTEYSEYVVQSLTAEWQPFIPEMTGLLLAFSGEPATYRYDELMKTLEEGGVLVKDISAALRFLVEANFLGVARGDGTYEYALTPEQALMMINKSARFKDQFERQKQFQIHRAFHRSLGIQKR